jgi:hypothetical protein
MKGRYKVLERQAKDLYPGIVASLRIDCWNGKGLTATEKQTLYKLVGDWVTAVLRAEGQRTRERVAADLAGRAP